MFDEKTYQEVFGDREVVAKSDAVSTPSGEWVAPDGAIRQFWNGKTRRQEIWLGRDRDSEAWTVSVLIDDEMFMFDHDDKASAEAMYLRLMSERIVSGAA